MTTEAFSVSRCGGCTCADPAAGAAAALLDKTYGDFASMVAVACGTNEAEVEAMLDDGICGAVVS